MKGQAKLMVWATTISFLGTLPLGTLNVSVANFMFHHDLNGAIGFSVAAIAVEMIIVRIALVAIRRLEKLKRYFRLFSLTTCAILLVLAFNTLVAAYEMRHFQASLPFAYLNPVLSGFLLSVLNPLHLPFWMGWTAVLRSKNILDDCPASHNRFVIAIGIGTVLGFSIYGIAGRYLIDLLGSKQVLLNWVVGIGLLATAIIQLYKTFFKQIKDIVTSYSGIKMIIMKNISRLTIISVFILLAGTAVAKHKYRTLHPSDSSSANGFAVVELFTSEGCSSCPPADAALARIAKTYPEHVVVLGFHVDYWNRLGWEDPYSNSAFSERQRRYAATSGSNDVYTPQAIINGTAQVVGSEEQKIDQLINRAIRKQVNQPIEINAAISSDHHAVTVSYQFANTFGTVLNIALLQRSALTDVRSGENSGRKLSHINVVRDFKTVSNKDGTVQLMIPEMLTPSDCSIAAYVQNKETMEIIGTTMLISIH